MIPVEVYKKKIFREMEWGLTYPNIYEKISGSEQLRLTERLYFFPGSGPLFDLIKKIFIVVAFTSTTFCLDE